MKSRSVLACLLFLLVCRSFAAENELKFGVFPYLPPSKLSNLFTPIADDFEKTLGMKVLLTSKGEYAGFTEKLVSEDYDLAFVQPFDYVTAHDAHNYLPVARRGGALRAIIVVKQDSPIQSIDELAYKTVANPPKVAAVSHLTSMALKKAGVNPDTGVVRDYGKSHFSCMQSVLIGTADACGTARQALSHFEKKNMSKRLRIVAESDEIPHSLFIVHKRVPEELRHKLADRILNWPNSSGGQKLLSNGKFIPFVAAKDSDYDIVRKYINHGLPNKHRNQ